MGLSRLLIDALGMTSVPTSVRSLPVADVTADSRHVTAGALFVAIPGIQSDGSRFIDEAVANGAVAVVAQSGPRAPCAIPLIRVPDARAALARLAATFFGLERVQRTGELTVTGITGTNGKSTIAFLLRAILDTAGSKTALLGTIEYDLVARKLKSVLTTPDPIELARHLVEAHRAGARQAVIEVSSHSLAQARTDGIRFAAAVFTNLTQDHLDYHGDAETYLRAKKRLFDRLDAAAAAVINADDPASAKIVADARCRVLTFGLRDDADVSGRILDADRSGTRFALSHEGRTLDVKTPLVGRHNVSNCLAAAAAALSLGIELGAVSHGIEFLAWVPGRLQRLPTPTGEFDVFVDYAHTDDALRNVLAAVRPLVHGRLWCVFGCGGDRDRTKRPRMARAVAQGADRFVITSDNPRTEDPLAIIADVQRGISPADNPRGQTIVDRARAIRTAIDSLQPGDVLVIAGKGHEDYQILGDERIHFDDVEVAADALARRKAGVPCAR